MATNESINTAVTEAFNAVRKGDLSKTSSLQHYGAKVVGDLRELLDDGNADIRREAVILLGTIDDITATSALVSSLNDENANIRERASEAVLNDVMRTGGTDIPDPGPEIVSAAEKSELSGSTILLLGYSQVGGEILQQAKDQTRMIKTSNAGPAVPVSLAAQLALSRRGDSDARAWLETHMNEANEQSLLFMLDNIGIIDSPFLLHALAAATFENETSTGRGVPSGAEPSRRVIDEAIIAFTKRLSLNTDFETRDVIRFEPEQVETVKNLIAGSMPQ